MSVDTNCTGGLTAGNVCPICGMYVYYGSMHLHSQPQANSNYVYYTDHSPAILAELQKMNKLLEDILGKLR